MSSPATTGFDPAVKARILSDLDIPPYGVTMVYTFGIGQSDIRVGRPLFDHYAVITAPSADICRSVMLGLFGRDWSMERSPDVWAELQARQPDSERIIPAPHARVVFGLAHPTMSVDDLARLCGVDQDERPAFEAWLGDTRCASPIEAAKLAAAWLVSPSAWADGWDADA